MTTPRNNQPLSRLRVSALLQLSTLLCLYLLGGPHALTHGRTQTAAPPPATPAAQLWRALAPAGEPFAEAQARAQIAQAEPAVAAALYRELLFDAVDQQLYGNPPIAPAAERVRTLLAAIVPAAAPLEAKLAAWAGDAQHKAGVGFAADSTGLEQLLYLYIAAEQKNVERLNEAHPTPPVTSRALNERALVLADELHVELAAASSAANVASYAMSERQRDGIPALTERAAAIWQRWQHPVGLVAAAYLRANYFALGQQWAEAAKEFRQTAELAAPLPALRPMRAVALDNLAWSLRNAGDQRGVAEALMAEVAERTQLVAAEPDEEKRSSRSKQLSDTQIQLGEALAALGRHTEAGEWYARADQLRAEHYAAERTRLEASISEMDKRLQAALVNPEHTAEQRQLRAGAFRTASETYLMLLSTLAAERNDTDTLVKLAERGLASARAGQDAGRIADALDALAKAQLAAGQLTAARATALEAYNQRAALPRRAWLYRSVETLAAVAAAADDVPETEARYRQVLELTRPDALPPVFDLAAEPNPDIRAVRSRMNNFERVTRSMSALEARRALANAQAEKGNYSAADEIYAALLGDVPQLFAMGAPDESELLRWLAARSATEAAALTATDIAAHRQQTGVTVERGETERLQNAELMVNSLRALLAFKRAGLLHDQGDLAAAAQAYRDAIKQVTNVTGGSFPLTGAYLALAQIERARGNYEAAEAPLQIALAAAQRQHSTDSIAGILAQTSALRREQGRLAEAQQLATDALKLARTTGQRSQVAGILVALARAETDQPAAAAHQAAEAHLREALAIGRELNLRTSVPYTLSDLGWALERQGREAEALAAYREAVGLVEGLTAALAQNVSAEVFNTKRGNRELYERLIKLLIRNGRTAEALETLERAKAKSLVEALAGAEVTTTDPQVKALIKRVRAGADAVRIAEATLATEAARPAAQRDAVRLAAAQAELARTQRTAYAAVAELQRADPAAASLITIKGIDLDRLRQRLPPRTLLLEYYPTADTLYIFRLSRTAAPTVTSVPVGHAALAALINDYRAAAVVPSKSAAFARATRGLFPEAETQSEVKRATAAIQTITGQLYDLLFAPVAADIERADTLLLVPAAELYYLPMHALGRLRPDGTVAYLLEQKRFAYLAAADTINAVAAVGAGAPAGTGQPGAGQPGLLALGNPDGSLPAAAEEVRTLGRIFPQAEIFTGPEATLAHVAAEARQQPVPYIHFATHGVINSKEPKESYLLLAARPGRLSVRDLIENTYGMSFRGTRLVTLSACQTSIGGWDPSAVYSSLSRAFAKAGAPTVVASLWSVNDAATRDTMASFYRELAAGQSKAEAMRRAQLAVLHDPRFAHPFFWAPFIILGDWQ